MNTNRETNHDMATDADIAFLLAEAADEVEIGIAPYQAVLRGGRRRRARRWAMAVAAALVIAGSTGTLALAGGTGGDGRRVAPAVTGPSTPEERHVLRPQVTTVARGTDHGKEWGAQVLVWGSPKNDTEARRQWTRMQAYGFSPTGIRGASELVGKGWVFVRLIDGYMMTTVLNGAVEHGDTLSGNDIEAASMPLDSDRPGGAASSQRLIIGKVAPTAEEVTCTWDDGTTIKAGKAAPGTGLGESYEDLIRPVDGSQPNWFVCVAPTGKHYGSGTAKVTR
ncbi:hypothetical protein [Streptomyces sp. NPDC005281]|uniref:hypothetical protein n=1 Tax=Streptomyces sp. NPDC005281 TaxID=3155712 RepID=UPI0033A282FE